MRPLWLFPLLTLLLLTVGSLSAEERAKVPDAKEQDKAEAIIKDLFKDEYAKTKAADKLDLSAKLFQQGVETKDDSVSRFVLLREAMNLAAAAGDLPQATKAAEELSRLYAVNGAELKVGIFEKLAPAVKAGDDSKAFVADVLPAVNEAIQADDFDTADRLLKVAATAATKSRSVALVSAVSARSKEVTRLRGEFVKVKEALATLEKKPTDAAANTVAGKYYCFVKGNWDKGLVMLVQGNDAKLKALAEKDAAGADKPQGQMEIADAWYELANAADTDASLKPQLQVRALNWYEQSVAGLSGLSKTKVEKRIAELEKVGDKFRDRGELFAGIRAAVKDKKMKNTAIVGFGIGKEIAETPTDGALLIGFEVGKAGKNDNIASLRPIYLTARGEKFGEQIGKAPDKVTTIKAKEGYAVGAMNLKTQFAVNGFSITFQRIDKTSLRKDDKYESEWFGGGKKEAAKIDGEGALIVGICGRKNDQDALVALGLVTLTLDAKDKK